MRQDQRGEKIALTFEEKSTLGRGWELEVRNGNRAIGHIRKSGTDRSYQYYHGFAQLNYEFEDTDLESLKRQISTRYGQ